MGGSGKYLDDIAAPRWTPVSILIGVQQLRTSRATRSSKSNRHLPYIEGRPRAYSLIIMCKWKKTESNSFENRNENNRNIKT